MRQSIYDLLKNFTSLDALKRLFWSELNYDRANQPLPTRTWNTDEQATLESDPLLLAVHGDFHVIYGQMANELSRTDQRTIINKLLPEHPYALFVFSDNAQRHWHFVNVKYDRDTNKRRIFRRITVEPGERLRTATERLSMLDLETVSRDLFGISPLAIQQRHDSAFDVEAVTRDFFKSYDKLFKQTEPQITALHEHAQRLFTQKLFNRLMFIMFLERKGWLQFNGREDYLRALWEDYKQRADDGSNFYWDRLYHLFFSGLNNPQNLMRINQGGYLASIIGIVPYLNGGLFEREDDDDNRNVLIPDLIFETAINELFYRYNFTIAESTPLDIEVAVDPEMLGKIFEELVTGRHESGSYYTPKPVVSFMCREALKGFLQTALSKETAAVLAQFVDHYNASHLHDPEAALAALRRVTVCDPACGSGAYLLGMLQELLFLRGSLFTAKNVDARSVYQRKLEIIQNNIYGVDKDEFAVNIARLRLWLSLVVDFELGREGDDLPTLPNLDYKVEVGDSLLAPDPSGGLQPDLYRQQQIKDYFEAKEQYLRSHGEEKKQLHEHVELLQAEIKAWAHDGKNGAGFDWAVEFAEVFDDGGFDIVLANPPYVRQELIKDIKPTLQKVYGSFYSGTADLYTYFYARAIQMLRTGGMLSFISSNKWLRADYGAKLRGVLAKNMQLETVIDFGDLPVFGAIAYPVIVAAQKRTSTGAAVRVLTPNNLDRLDDLRGAVDEEAIDVDLTTLTTTSWSFGDRATHQRLQTMRATGVPLANLIEGRVYRGISTGLNDAFVINGATRAALIAEDARSADLIKPFARGKDVKRWRIDQADLWIIFTRRGVKIDSYPAIKAYLEDYREQLEPKPRNWPSNRTWSGRKPGSYKWYELQDDIAYYDKFEHPKIVCTKMSIRPTFAFDDQMFYLSNTTYLFVPANDPFFTLGVLNSDAFQHYAKDVFVGKQGS